jgi:hypothetical protein
MQSSKEPTMNTTKAAPPQFSVWKRETYKPSQHGDKTPTRQGADDHKKYASKGF